MYCPLCGTPVGDNDNNCTQCGAALKAQETVATEPVAEPIAEPVVEPVVEPIAEPIAEPVAEPVIEQAQGQAYYTQPDYQYQNNQEFNYQPQGYQPDFNNPYFHPQPIEDPGKNLGIASLVLAIVGTVTCCCPVASALSAISPVCLIVAIVLGFIAKSKSKAVNIKNKLALAGIILSFVPIVLFVAIVAIVTSAIIATDGAIFQEIFRILEEAGLGDYSYMFEDMLGEFENMI